MDSAVQDWLHRYGSKSLHEKFQRLRAFPQHRNRVGYPDLKGAFLEAGFTVQDVALVTQFGEPRAGVQWDALLAQIGTALQQIGAVPAAGTARRDTSQEGPLRENEGRYDKERRCVVPAAAISCVLHDMRCAEADVKECFSYMFPQDRNFVNIEPLIKFLAGASGGSESEKDHSVSDQTVQKLQAGAGENGLSTDQLIDDLKEHGVSSHAVEEKLRQNDFARGLTFAQIRTLSGIGRGEKFHDGPKKHRPCFRTCLMTSGFHLSLEFSK
eukprot:g3855.t1